MTPLGIATGGLLDRGQRETESIATEGLLSRVTVSVTTSRSGVIRLQQSTLADVLRIMHRHNAAGPSSDEVEAAAEVAREAVAKAQRARTEKTKAAKLKKAIQAIEALEAEQNKLKADLETLDR